MPTIIHKVSPHRDVEVVRQRDSHRKERGAVKRIPSEEINPETTVCVCMSVGLTFPEAGFQALPYTVVRIFPACNGKAEQTKLVPELSFLGGDRLPRTVFSLSTPLGDHS